VSDTQQASPPLSLAIKFHETYERLAPSFGYETRKETRAFDPTTPNGRLMVAVCAELIASLPTADQQTPLRDEASTPTTKATPDQQTPLPAERSVVCKHSKIIRGDDASYDTAWCDDCGQITWASDGTCDRPKAHDRRDWCARRLIAWSCKAEAEGRDRCAYWCSYCTASIHPRIAGNDAAIASQAGEQDQTVPPTKES
jgi:hypothetical protein